MAAAAPFEQTHSTDDIHDLVTLEPSLRDYVHLPPSPEHGSNPNGPDHHQSSSGQLSSPLFSSFSPTDTNLGSEPGPSHAHSRPASMSQRRSTRWPFLGTSSRASGTTSRQSAFNESPRSSMTMPDQSDLGKAGPSHTLYTDTSAHPSAPPTIVLSAQKDSDDVDDSYDVGHRRTVARRNTSTSTRVNHLFGMSSPTPPTSREPSYQKQPSNFSYTRSQPGETATLPHHLLDRGLMQGKHSDITVKVFGNEYKLHRIILDRAPFFASALSPPWCEANQREVELHPEDTDTNITQKAFELALKRLYGCSLQAEEDEEAICLFATGCWLEMQDLIQDSTMSIMKKMSSQTLSPVIQVVSANYYGRPGDRLLESAKAMLCRNGADMALSAWDGISSELVRELVGGDGFFVSDEWNRWRLAKRLLDRRLKNVAKDAGLWTSHSCQVPVELRDRAIREQQDGSVELRPRSDQQSNPLKVWTSLYSHPDIRPLLSLLDEDTYYMHMTFEQLQSARGARDVLGVPVLPDAIIQDALWANLELRQRVLNAPERGRSIGLLQTTTDSERGTQQDPLGATRPEATKDDAGRRDGEITSVLSSKIAGPIGMYRQWLIPSIDRNMALGGDEGTAFSTRSLVNRAARRATSHVVSQPESADDTEGVTTELDRLEANVSDEAGSEGAHQRGTSKFPPFRFAVELPSARLLKDRRKVFSQTVFYAGSHWNVYIKKVKSGTKIPHLGVYLHRAPQQQSTSFATPSKHGSVDRRIGALEQRMQSRPAGHRASNHLEHMSGHIADRTHRHGGSERFATDDDQYIQHPYLPNLDQSFTPYQHFSTSPNVTSYASSSSGSSSPEPNASVDISSLTYQPPRPQVPTLSPYVDRRPTINTYFKIFSTSRGGRLLNIYESVPCNFNYSQSWGWKSSALMAEDEAEDEQDDVILPLAETSFVTDGQSLEDQPESSLGKVRGGSGAERRCGGLRFVVVLGVV